MLKLVESMDMDRYFPRTYVVAKTDAMSGQKACTSEQKIADAKAAASLMVRWPACLPASICPHAHSSLQLTCTHSLDLLLCTCRSAPPCRRLSEPGRLPPCST
jgi:hypothetical protein